MKLAVSYTKENNEIFFHFGKTEDFKIYTIEDGKVTASEIMDVRACAHGTLPEHLGENCISTVICGGIGIPMVQKLEGYGIELFCGITGNADKAVEAYLAGELKSDKGAVHACHGHG